MQVFIGYTFQDPEDIETDMVLGPVTRMMSTSMAWVEDAVADLELDGTDWSEEFVGPSEAPPYHAYLYFMHRDKIVGGLIRTTVID